MRRCLVVPFMLFVAGEPAVAQSQFSVVEASIADMQSAMASGRVTSRELVQQYLTRIAIYDKKLGCVITVNPNALREARSAIASARKGRYAARSTALRLL